MAKAWTTKRIGIVRRRPAPERAPRDGRRRRPPPIGAGPNIICMSMMPGNCQRRAGGGRVGPEAFR